MLNLQGKVTTRRGRCRSKLYYTLIFLSIIIYIYIYDQRDGDEGPDCENIYTVNERIQKGHKFYRYNESAGLFAYEGAHVAAEEKMTTTSNIGVFSNATQVPEVAGLLTVGEPLILVRPNDTRRNKERDPVTLCNMNEMQTMEEESKRLDAQINALGQGMTDMINDNFSIFTYPLQEHGGILTVRKENCADVKNNRGYWTERYFAQWIQNGVDGRFATTNGDEADMFLMPLLPCDKRFDAEQRGVGDAKNYQMGKDLIGQYMIAAYQYISTQFPYYKNPKIAHEPGADHFWVSAQDGGVRRAMVSGHHLFNNTIVLVNSAETRRRYTPCWDVSTVPNVDFVRAEMGRNHTTLEMRGEGNAARPRDHKVFFAGNPKSHATRQAIFDELKESPLFNLHGKALLPERYIFALKRHTYCLHLPGHATWSPRLIEYIWFGCIPVVVGSEYFLPLSGMVDWRLFSIGIGIEEISNLPELLQTVSKQRQQHLRNNLHKVAPLFMYHAKPRFGDAFYATLYQLYRRSRFIQRGLTKTDLYEFRHIARQQAKPYGAPHGGLVASYAYAPVCDLRLSWVYQTNDECKKGGKPYSITGNKPGHANKHTCAAGRLVLFELEDFFTHIRKNAFRYCRSMNEEVAPDMPYLIALCFMLYLLFRRCRVLLTEEMPDYGAISKAAWTA